MRYSRVMVLSPATLSLFVLEILSMCALLDPVNILEGSTNPVMRTLEHLFRRTHVS